MNVSFQLPEEDSVRSVCNDEHIVCIFSLLLVQMIRRETDVQIQDGLMTISETVLTRSFHKKNDDVKSEDFSSEILLNFSKICADMARITCNMNALPSLIISLANASSRAEDVHARHTSGPRSSNMMYSCKKKTKKQQQRNRKHMDLHFQTDRSCTRAAPQLQRRHKHTRIRKTNTEQMKPPKR